MAAPSRRFAMLNHLLAAGPRTASQCAAVVGESASNCSWHLRALAKVGLVEPAPQPDGDARTRPWQATAVGFDFAGSDGPAARVAESALGSISAQHAEELYRRYLARRELLPERWTEVADASGYALRISPDELRSLLAAVDGLIRPYVRPIRRDAPDDSAVVHVTLRAFLDPDVDHRVERTPRERAASTGRRPSRRGRPALRGRGLDAVHRAAAVRAAAERFAAGHRDAGVVPCCRCSPCRPLSTCGWSMSWWPSRRCWEASSSRAER